MHQRASQSWLLRLAAKALKYFSLSLAGCILAYVISAVLGLPPLAYLVGLFLQHIASRAFILVACLVFAAVIAESIKS